MVCDASNGGGEVDLRPKYLILRNPPHTDANSLQQLEEDLEAAFESGVEHIVIEPDGVGSQTYSWITWGNLFHKSAVLLPIVSCFTPLVCPARYRAYLTVPLCVTNLLCVTVYNVSWSKDPCCKYQVEHNTQRIDQLHLHTLATASPLILVHRDDKYRKRLHNFIAACCAGYLVTKLYRFVNG